MGKRQPSPNAGEYRQGLPLTPLRPARYTVAMTEPASTGPTPRPGAATSSTTPGMRWVLAAIAVVVLSLLFGIWGAWQLFAPGSDHPQRQLADQAAQIEQLQQQVATLSRSDQISRDANRDVQNTLAEMARRIDVARVYTRALVELPDEDLIQPEVRRNHMAPRWIGLDHVRVRHVVPADREAPRRRIRRFRRPIRLR